MSDTDKEPDRADCPDCGARTYYVVDGQRMTQETLLDLPSPPRAIERRIDHRGWPYTICPRRPR